MSDENPDWVAWNGGGCPVGRDQYVEVRLRYDRIVRSGQAGAMRWSHDLYCAYGAEDVVAYRLLAGAPPER